MGPLEQRVQALLARGRARGLDGLASAVAHDPDWQNVFLDSTIVRAHACAAGQPKAPRGRSRGGFSTPIHALTDALGHPLDFELTGGQAADITQAEGLWPDEPVGAVVADKSYDAEAFVATVRARGAAAVIPPRKHCKQPREYDRPVYQERPLIECFLGKIKHYRRIFSRFEKTAHHSMGFLRFVAALVWLR
jgi:transposase